MKLRHLQNQTFAPLPKKLSGLCYSPFREGQSPASRNYPSARQISEDLALISQYTDSIRTYSVHRTLGLIPGLAAQFGLDVVLGIWIGPDEEKNEVEIQRAIAIANEHDNVSAILVGNETLFRHDVSIDQLKHYLTRVRAATALPVSCSEQWHIWQSDPDLAAHVDLIAVHILPFWEPVPQRHVQEVLLARLTVLNELFPDMLIVVSEMGWPSGGRRSNTIQSTTRQQRHYLLHSIHLMKQRHCRFYIIEAFDQPWKTEEGAVGAQWGIMDAARRPKFSFDTSLLENLSSHSFAHDLIDGSALQHRSRLILPLLACTWIALVLAISMISSSEYSTAVMIGASSLVLLNLTAGLFTEIHEWLEAAWTSRSRRMFLPVLARDAIRPTVSIHLPCCNEPPDMVISTLNALAAMDYPDFEVIVVDNNTHDPAIWTPVQQHCQRLGPQFRFFHLDSLDGFKAGALNYALVKTAANAQVIGVVDSDYCVSRHWLKMMVPHFSNPAIALVQCPQDYSDGKHSLFKRSCFAEYKGFFSIGMVIRNDHNAIIQHGTMTLVRRGVLEELGWANWCICEDAELGLRILQKGHLTAYSLQSCGRGLTPDTFIDFKKQRSRWAYGAVQILKRHRKSLFRGTCDSLNGAQRYYFIAGWLPWINEGIAFLFTLFSLLWTLLMLLPDLQLHAPPVVLPLSLITIYLVKISKTLHLYQRLVGLDLRDAMAAVVAGLALYHTIARAVMSGLFTRNMPFFRTPKNADSHGLLVAISEVREELFIMLLLWGAALGICLVQGLPSNDMRFWVTMLLVQSLPYLAALIMAFLSSLPKPKASTEPATA
ncbi:glycosyltransferase [Pseudomonas sp. Bc-h]|jgi:exo-beta-1,3-glucanase (GH17 family)/cellulose synthase/poly-beta-1,6-N-acetylglucosamine synthase-like glycosyltransferase|uniref:glycosyltransferase n=1 Tax=Pseudomonas sp. Bc-h TaxID=1943632 RepID=UPI00143DA83B|nr:glycosyltransferase [Pseudomonas sp. Bc-h]